jgi:hypothetical protein
MESAFITRDAYGTMTEAQMDAMEAAYDAQQAEKAKKHEQFMAWLKELMPEDWESQTARDLEYWRDVFDQETQ